MKNDENSLICQSSDILLKGLEKVSVVSSFDILFEQHPSQKIIHPILIHDYLQTTTGITEKQFKMRMRELNDKMNHQEKLISEYLSLSY